MPLRETGRYINGRGFKPDDWKTSGRPIVRIKNLTDPTAPFDYFDGEVDDGHAIDSGDLLVSWSASLDAYIWDRGPAVVNQHIFKVVPDERRVRKDYLYFALREAMHELDELVHGATMKHVTRPVFEGFEIPLPPLAEQERIARRLTEGLAHVERARAAAQARLAAAQSLPAAYLREVFEGPEASGWETRRLSNVLAETRNGLYKPDKFYGSGVPIIKMYNIGRFDGQWYLDRLDLIRLDPAEHALYRLEPGDIIINRVNSRELVGKAAVIDERLRDAVFESKNIRARVGGNADPHFFTYWLNSAFARTQIESRIKQIVGQATLNRDDLDSLEMPSPPLPAQRRIAESLSRRLAAAERLAAGIREELAAIEALPAALLREAFGGSEVRNA